MISFTAEDADSAIVDFRSVRHLVHCSTVATFGRPLEAAPIDETAPDPLVIEYGRHKVEADQVLREAHLRSEVAITIMKPAQTWDPDNTLIGQLDFSTSWLGRVRKHKPLIISGDGQTLWSLCHADDVGRAFAAAVDREACKGQDYIVTGPRWITWQEYRERVSTLLGSRSEIVHVPAATIFASSLGPYARVLRSESLWNRSYDVSKVMRDIPEFRPSIDFECGLFEVVSWLDEHGATTPDKEPDDAED